MSHALFPPFPGNHNRMLWHAVYVSGVTPDGMQRTTASTSTEGVYAATLYTYDPPAPQRPATRQAGALAAPVLTCQDLDLDGIIDLSGPDRVSDLRVANQIETVRHSQIKRV